MANEQGKKTDAGTAEGETKIVWDDTSMHSVYANVANVTGGREELIVLFGMNQAWQPGQKEVKIQLTERVVLNPFAAKRLSVLLTRTISEYEKRFGALDIGMVSPEGIPR
jgi:hypothetical protein